MPTLSLPTPPSPTSSPPSARVHTKSRGLKRKPRIEDDGEGNWLVSYADMMTLMVGFFVMMSAFSTPDAQKLEKLKAATAQAMGTKYISPYEQIAKELHEILKGKNLQNEVDLQVNDSGIVLICRGTLFFDSGSTALKERALTLTETIAKLLVQKISKKGFQISVEGHTDDNPIVSKYFPSNWELSSSRASTVVRLFESTGFEHSELRPVGLADTEPMVPNRDNTGKSIPDNQSINRRIVMRIQKIKIAAKN